MWNYLGKGGGDYLVADFHHILIRLKNNFSQLLKVGRFSGFRQMEIQNT
jgi:hypothetical protein